MNDIVISFPHMGEYHIIFQRLFKSLLPKALICVPPPITKKTIGLGSRYSPDFVCTPFKYNMGNYIEALEHGANVLIQTGMGCRYGYYGEVQEQILRDMGYEFQFMCFSRSRAKPRIIYKALKDLGSPFNALEVLRQVGISIAALCIIDKVNFKLREIPVKEASTIKQRIQKEIAVLDSFSSLIRAYIHYLGLLKQLKAKTIEKPLRIGIVGELFTLMEPFSNSYIEDILAGYNTSVSRMMSVSFLLLGKNDRLSLKRTDGYLTQTIGANGVDSIAQSLKYAKCGYDGIVHLKSFGCTPELNAIPVLQKISQDYNIPLLQLSFDTHTSETGLNTRIEAFCDMLMMKRKQKDGENRQLGCGHRLNFNKRRFTFGK